MMRLITTLLASSLLLIGCSGGVDTSGKDDLSTLRSKCMELSGYTGNAQFTEGTVFVWRADGAEVAECNIHNSHVHLVGILGSGNHPAD